jgi:hypothetical protein
MHDLEMCVRIGRRSLGSWVQGGRFGLGVMFRDCALDNTTGLRLSSASDLARLADSLKAAAMFQQMDARTSRDRFRSIERAVRRRGISNPGDRGYGPRGSYAHALTAMQRRFANSSGVPTP